MTTDACRRLDRAAWVLLVLALAGQYLLFRGHVEREVAWGYPPRWDQAFYLTQAYATHIAWERSGAREGLATAWNEKLPQSLLLPFEAALLMQLLGASRLTALTLIFLHFALLQVALVTALRRLAPGWTAPALALGLLWSLRSPAWWGGLADFRLDFMAMCLQGVWLCLALRADTLARRRGAALAGGAAALLTLTRYLTFVYTWATLAAFVLLELGLARDGRRRARAGGAALVLALVTLTAGPFLWLNRDAIRAYYGSGQGATFALWAGVNTRADAWLFYPRSLRDHHTGPLFLALAALTLLVAAGVWLRRRTRGRPAPVLGGDRDLDLPAAARLLACAVLAPLTVLNVIAAKSDVVGSVLLPGLTLLLVLPVVALLRRGAGRPALRGLAALVLVAGLAHLVAFLRGPGELNAEHDDSRAITRLHAAIARVSLARGWSQPVELVDSAQDHTVPWVTSVVGYERFGELVEPRLPIAPTPWAAVTEPQVRAALAQAQIVVVTRGAGPPRPPRAIFDHSMAALRPLILAACARDFERLGRFHLRGRDVLLFARAAPPDPRAPR